MKSIQKLKYQIIGFIIGTLLISILLANKAFGAYPSPNNYVNDFANVLSQNFENRLNTALKEFEDKTTNEIAILTVNSTNPDTIEEYSIRVAQQWKVGQKDKDNGVLMVFAMQDRKMRIEVGRGLEGDLTDIESKKIIEDIIVPRFKSGKVEMGIEEGTSAVIFSITDSEIATVATQPTNSNKGDIVPIIIFIVTIVGLIIVAGSGFSPLGGEGDNRLRGVWVPKKNSKWGKTSFGTIQKEYNIPIVPPVIMGTVAGLSFKEPRKTIETSYVSRDSDDDSDNNTSDDSWGSISIGGGSFGGFGGGSFSGGGSSGSW